MKDADKISWATKRESWDMYVKMVKSGARPCVLLEANIYKWIMQVSAGYENVHSWFIQDKVEIPEDLVLIRYDHWNPPWGFLILKDQEKRVTEICAMKDGPEKCYLVGELLGFPYPMSECVGDEKKFTLYAKDTATYKIVYFVVPHRVKLEEMIVWAKPIIDVLYEDYELILKLNEEIHII